jgi:hypothetical protein
MKEYIVSVTLNVTAENEKEAIRRFYDRLEMDDYDDSCIEVKEEES